jgi:prophage regulatory protein
MKRKAKYRNNKPPRKRTLPPVVTEPGRGPIIQMPERRMLTKREVLARVRVTYPTIWKWMREGRFPRSRAMGFRSMWFEHEVEAWLESLPNTPLKGDKLVEA